MDRCLDQRPRHVWGAQAVKGNNYKQVKRFHNCEEIRYAIVVGKLRCIFKFAMGLNGIQITQLLVQGILRHFPVASPYVLGNLAPRRQILVFPQSQPGGLVWGFGAPTI